MNIDNYWDKSFRQSKPSLLSRYVNMARQNLYLSGGSSGFNNNDDGGKSGGSGGGDGGGGRNDDGPNDDGGEDGFGKGPLMMAAVAPFGIKKFNDNGLNLNVIEQK